MKKHRRARILDALAATLETLTAADTPVPLRVETVQKRFIHWTALDSQGAIPAILLNYGDNRQKRQGGSGSSASLGETEERLPFALTVVLKESAATPAPMTDQISDAIYSIERLINGAADLGIDGVRSVEVDGDRSSEGAISALEGTPFEVIKFRIVVTHVYRSNTAV